MDHLRLIGFGITALVLLILAVLSGRRKTFPEHSGGSNLEQRVYPEDEILRVKKITPEGESVVVDFRNPTATPAAQSVHAPVQRDTPRRAEPPATARPKTTLLVYYVVAPANEPFVGYELIQSLQAAGLSYGENNIFHRIQDGECLFSVAQATQEGRFDMDAVGTLRCRALTVFRQTCGEPSVDADAHQQLLETLEELADTLGATVLDQNKQTVLAAVAQ